MKARLTMAACGAGLGFASAAHAAPPGNWSIGVERLFGISRVTTEVEVPGGTQKASGTAISLFGDLETRRDYSPARLALDYLSSSGLSFGGALGYASQDGDFGDQSVWLIAPRLGYFARPGDEIGLWPRAGLTHTSIDNGADDTATAITLEMPLVLLLGRGIGLSITPYADVGIGGEVGGVDRTITEIGLQLGFSAFL